MATNSEMLELVRNAIAAILTGNAVQRYVLAGKDIQKYSLQELQALETYYTGKVASETGARTFAEFRSP
jgi:hypothetical protein